MESLILFQSRSGSFSGGNWQNIQGVQSSLPDHAHTNHSGTSYYPNTQVLNAHYNNSQFNAPMCSSNQYDEQYVGHENQTHHGANPEENSYQYGHSSLGEPVSEMMLEETFDPVVQNSPDETQLDQPNPGDMIELSLTPKKTSDIGPTDFPMPKTPQGKLRVIAQSMLNASENIQTPSRGQETQESRVPEKIPLPEMGSENNHEAEVDEAPTDLVSSNGTTTTITTNSTVIQTPLNANQVAWLTSQCSSTTASTEKGQTFSVPTTEEEAVDRVEVPGGTWILTNPKKDEEGAWTVPADDPQQPKVLPIEADNESSNQGNWHLLANTSNESSQTPPEEADSKKMGDQMLAIRSGISLLLQSKKRKRTKEDATDVGNHSPSSSSKKGDLGIRKDLTLPSAPKPGEDNVFQSDDLTRDLTALQFPVVQLDEDDDCELTIRGIAESGQSGLIRTATTSEEYQCVECSMGFPKAAQLRLHVK